MHTVVGQRGSLIKVECADGSMGSARQRQVLGTTHAAADRCRADGKIVSIGTPPRDSKGSASLLTFSDDGRGSDLSFGSRGRWLSPRVSDGESAQSLADSAGTPGKDTAEPAAIRAKTHPDCKPPEPNSTKLNKRLVGFCPQPCV